MKKLIVYFLIFLFTGCGMLRTVRNSDLNAWRNIPVLALDTHSLFLTVPMVKTFTENGIEIRVYANKANFSSCTGSGSIDHSTTLSSSDFNNFRNCSARVIGCDNIFYIKDGNVIKYIPVGRCYTDNTVRPQKGWESFR